MNLPAIPIRSNERRTVSDERLVERRRWITAELASYGMLSIAFELSDIDIEQSRRDRVSHLASEGTV